MTKSLRLRRRVAAALGASRAASLWADRRVRLIAVPLLLVAIIAGSVTPRLVSLENSAAGHQKASKPISSQAYHQNLHDQVSNQDGSPISGRDPAAQSQTSLADAAATPSGSGTRTNTPAAGLNGNNGSKTTPGSVYGDPAKTGINDAGCYIDYGVQGQECLPAHAANDDGTLSCDGVREHFPKGIKVTGTDRFHLDKNGDKTACGQGD